MLFSYDGAYALPGVRDEVTTFENQFWLGRAEVQLWFPTIVSGAARDSGKSSYTHVLRSGLVLGRITATNKLIEWTPTATDGSEKVFGILDLPLNMQRLGNNQDRYMGQTLIRGYVDPARLLVPGQSSLGIAGTTHEHLLRAQLHQAGFLLSDNFYGNPIPWRDVVAKTADYTILEADNNTLFTNRGASGAVVLTLPATAKKGLRYGVYVAANQNLTLTAGTTGTLVVFNDAAANSISFQTANEIIGGMFEVIGDGTGWLVINHLGAEAQTITIAT